MKVSDHEVASTSNRITSKIAALTIVASVVPSLAGDLKSPGVRNCTWCHGTSGQGVSTAPRLAGQKSRYLENQLQNFYEHRRDNPFSKQYMWGATASLSPQSARDLAVYFAALPARAAGDGNPDFSVAGEESSINRGCRRPMSSRARSVTARTPRVRAEIPRLGGLSYFYLKRQTGAVGRRAITPRPRRRCRASPANCPPTPSRRWRPI